MQNVVTRGGDGRFRVENERADLFEFYMTETKGESRLQLAGAPKWHGGARPANAVEIGRARSDGLPV